MIIGTFKNSSVVIINTPISNARQRYHARKKKRGVNFVVKATT